MPESRKSVFLVSPAGVAKFPRLNEPDTKFNAEGVYKVTLVLKEGDKGVADYLKALRQAEADALAEAAKNLKKGKKLKESGSVIKESLDGDGNPVSGQVEINFKMKASGTSKKSGKAWERHPAIFDAQLRPCTDVKVGGGSIVKVKAELRPFDSPAFGAGLSLGLEAVQVIELREYSAGQSAAGFDKEEGFEASAGAEGFSAGQHEEPAGEPAPAPAAAKGGKKATPRKKGDF